ncbi:MAG: hypothetical protein ACE5EF_00125 [Dehalococcoidia bacterium]
MNWQELQDQARLAIGAVAGELDAEIIDFCQNAILDIHAEGRWPWDRDSVSIRAEKLISGTCTYSQGATTVTLDTGGVSSQATADLYDHGLIQLEGGSTYTISAYSQATQSVTVDTTIVDASKAAAAGTYEMIQETIELPSNVEAVIELRDQLDSVVLREIPRDKRSRLFPDPFDRGTLPTHWWIRGVSPSGNLLLAVYPPPAVDRAYQVEFWRRPVLPTVGTQELEAVTGIPARFHPVVVARAKAKAFEFEDAGDTKRALAEAEYITGIQRMKRYSRASVGGTRQRMSTRTRRPFWGFDDHVEITGV